MSPPAYTASPCAGSALFSNSRAPPPPPPPSRLLLLRRGTGAPYAAGRYGGRVAPSQERRRPVPPQEKRRPSELPSSSRTQSQLPERKRHWKAGEFPAGTATADGGGGGGRLPAQGKRHSKAGEFPGTDAAFAPPQGKRHWKASEFPGTAAGPGSGTPRTPLKNVKKRLDAHTDAKAWACPVTERAGVLKYDLQGKRRLTVTGSRSPCTYTNMYTQRAGVLMTMEDGRSLGSPIAGVKDDDSPLHL